MGRKRHSVRHELQSQGGQFEGRVFWKIVDLGVGVGVIRRRCNHWKVVRCEETRKDMLLWPGIDDSSAVVADPFRARANTFRESTSKTVIDLIVDHIASLCKRYDIIYNCDSRRFKQHLRLESPLALHTCNCHWIKSA